MILNNAIWKQTIEAAKAKSTGNPAMLRAIDRAVIEIEKAIYWAFAAGVLKIQSTTSRKLYVVDDSHTCEAIANGHKYCKHTVARRLMVRYSERLAASELECKTVTVRNWSANGGYSTGRAKRLAVVPAKSSMLVEASQAVTVKRTVRGEVCNGIDV